VKRREKSQTREMGLCLLETREDAPGVLQDENLGSKGSLRILERDRDRCLPTHRNKFEGNLGGGKQQFFLEDHLDQKIGRGKALYDACTKSEDPNRKD